MFENRQRAAGWVPVSRISHRAFRAMGPSLFRGSPILLDSCTQPFYGSSPHLRDGTSDGREKRINRRGCPQVPDTRQGRLLRYASTTATKGSKPFNHHKAVRRNDRVGPSCPPGTYPATVSPLCRVGCARKVADWKGEMAWNYRLHSSNRDRSGFGSPCQGRESPLNGVRAAGSDPF
jgi:hypothetical protein